MFGALLLLTAVSCAESVRYEFVKNGARVTLPCENFRSDQVQCDGTSWLFSNSKSYEVVKLGKIPAKLPQLRDRLRTTENCSLQIKDVRPDDAGKYSCQQYDRFEDGPTLVPSTHVTLSVISVTEQKNEASLSLTCSVSTSLSVSVTWRVPGQAVDQHNAELNPVNLRNGLKITVPQSHYLFNNIKLFKCEVTDKGKPHLFNVTFSISDKAHTPAPPITEKRDDEDDEDDKNGFVWWWAVVAAAVLSVLVVLGVVWRKLKAKPDVESSGPSDQPEEELSYATISFNKNHRTEVRLDEEAVTYSSVRNKAPDDPAQLYATVNT